MWAVAGCAVACRLLFLRWTDHRAISADLRSWELVVRTLAAGQNPYQATAVLNWPPLWMQVLFALRWLADALGVPTLLAVRLFLIASEAGLLIATDRLMIRVGTPRRRLVLLLGFALNPVCILLTVQHGNFDVLVALAIVLFLDRLARFLDDGEAGSWLLSAFFLGVAATLKMAPAILIPLLAAGARRLSRSTRFAGFLLAAGPALYGFSVVFVLSPAQVARNILGYRSISGWFGVTGILHFFRLDAAIPWYGRLFAAAMILAASAAGMALWRREEVSLRPVLLLALILLIAIPFLGGGYGPQYFFWFWPLLLAAAQNGSETLRLAAGVFAGAAAATYTAQYALMEVLGGFLLWKSGDPFVSLAALTLRSNRAVALSNGPLFLAYAFLFVAILRERATSSSSSPAFPPLPGSIFPGAL